MAVDITQPCNKWCSSMVWSKREGATCTYTYTYESSATSESDPARAESIRFTVDQYNMANGKLLKSIKKDLALDAGEFSFDLVTGCFYFYFTMQLRNRCGASGNLSTNKQYISWPPKVPRDSLKIEYDPTVTGKNLTYGFTGINNADQSHRNEPRKNYVAMLFKSQFINGSLSESQVDAQTVLGWDNSETVEWSSNTSFTLPTQDAEWVKFTLQVSPVNIAGTTYEIDKNEKIYYVAMAPVPAITNFTKSTGGEGAVVSVKYNQCVQLGYAPQHPMDTLSLQVQYAQSANALVASGWKDIGEAQTVETKVGDVTAGFYIADADISPTKGEHVFLRAKAAWKTLTPQYSSPYLVPDEFYFQEAFTYEDNAPETGTDGVTISSVTTGDDGQSLVAVIGYDNITKYDACELGYSTDKDAWWSTSQPETIQLEDTTWKTTTKLAPKNTYATKVKITDLDEDTTYYLRARRYKVDDDSTMSKWSVQKQGDTGGELTGLVLTAGDVIATNKPCTFTWNFPDGLKQTEWFLKDASTGAAIEQGKGSVSIVTHAFSSAGTKKFVLTSFFDNNKSMDSNTVSVKVVDPPVVSFKTKPPSVVNTLPVTFHVTSDVSFSQIQATIKSMGIQTRTPEGFATQYKGDVVYSNSFVGSGMGCTTYTNADYLWNGGRYMVCASATANGVTSDEITFPFTVAYSERVSAPEPTNVTITPNADKSATITVKNLASGITWDLYRATKDTRNSLIAKGLASGASVTDKFAPFCSKTACNYIVLVKNIRNQFDFREYAYTADYGVLRFDWNNTFVELPYNIGIEDETDKQFEQQVYLDGTQKGAWGASVMRSASLSTDTVYIKDEEVQKKVRELARYQGAVFVRTPLGQAYTANVEVNNISKTYDKKTMAVSFECTEIDLTNDFTIAG